MILAATNILAVTAWLASAAFVARFLLTTWYKRTAGVLLMVFVLAGFTLLSLAAVTAIWGLDWPGRESARLVVYAALNVLLWSGLVVLVHDQRRSRSGPVR